MTKFYSKTTHLKPLVAARDATYFVLPINVIFRSIFAANNTNDKNLLSM